MISKSTTAFNTSSNKAKITLVGLGALVTVVAIFSREIGKGGLFGLDIDYVAYPAYILFAIALFVTASFSISRAVLTAFMCILVSGLFSKLWLGLSIAPLIKQFLPIVLIYSVVAFAIRKKDPERIFKWYVFGAYISAWIGILQFALKLFLGYQFLTPYNDLFVDSIAEEPSHYAVIVLPAVIYTFMRRTTYMNIFLVLLIATLLTFNLTAYVVLGFMLLLIYRRLSYLVILVPILYLIGDYLYDSLEGFRLRIDGMITYIFDQSFHDLHGTPLSFFSNWAVAMETIKQSPLFGSGLGGHEEMYHRYFDGHLFSRLDYLYGLNASSAHSLTIRVLSELGIVGFVTFVYIVTRPLTWRQNPEVYAIGLACLSHFICKTLKLGNYFDLGTPFFLLIIYLLGEAIKRQKRL